MGFITVRSSPTGLAFTTSKSGNNKAQTDYFSGVYNRTEFPHRFSIQTGHNRQAIQAKASTVCAPFPSLKRRKEQDPADFQTKSKSVRRKMIANHTV